MAKRNTGVGSKNKDRKPPHKTKKRLVAKFERIAALTSKRRG